MIEIKTYGNGSYSYFSTKLKRHLNINSDLGKMILEVQRERSIAFQTITSLRNELFLHTEIVHVCKECDEVVPIGRCCGNCRGDYGTYEMTLKEYENK